jgi:undecaprenyl-phosphate alpha-N-acetylglucosaminyl 1-phosphatetransferase
MTYILLFFCAIILSLLIIVTLIPLANNFGLLDKPGDHKLHAVPVPVVGGLAVYLCLMILSLLLQNIGIKPINITIATSLFLLFSVGLIDDRHPLPVNIRLGIQILSSIFLVFSNVVIKDFGALLTNDFFTIGLFSIPLTVIAIVGVINSINMIDGIDGLLGTLYIVILLPILFVSYFSSNYDILILVLCIIGSLIGFLLFNFRRQGFNQAKVFMGDSGSTMLGFLLAYLLITLSQGEHRTISPVVTLWFVAIPLMDTLGVMIRRANQKRSLFHGDHSHLHHLMINAGFRIRHTVYLISITQLFLGTAGLISYNLGLPDNISFLAFILTFISYTTFIHNIDRATESLSYFHNKLGLTKRGSRYIYINNLDQNNPVAYLENIFEGQNISPQYAIYLARNEEQNTHSMFAVIDVKHTDNIKKYIKRIKISLRNQKNQNNTIIRQFIERSKSYKGNNTIDYRNRTLFKGSNRRLNKISLFHHSVVNHTQLRDIPEYASD